MLSPAWAPFGNRNHSTEKAVSSDMDVAIGDRDLNPKTSEWSPIMKKQLVAVALTCAAALGLVTTSFAETSYGLGNASTSISNGIGNASQNAHYGIGNAGNGTVNGIGNANNNTFYDMGNASKSAPYGIGNVK